MWSQLWRCISAVLFLVPESTKNPNMTKKRHTLPRLLATALAAVLMGGAPTAAFAAEAPVRESAPIIVTQPASITVAEGEDAAFTVAFTGEPAPTVQWERSDDDGVSWVAVPEATTGSFTMAAVTVDDSGGQFRVHLSSAAGTAISESAILTVDEAATTDAAEGSAVTDTREVTESVDTSDPADSTETTDADDADASDDTALDGSSTKEDAAATVDADTRGEAVAEGSAADDPSSDASAATDVEALAATAAASSSAALLAGTYTITANLYVDGSDAPIGVNAYLTDSGFPPITAQSLNATLVVDDDGTSLLTLPVVQETFTLQHIGDTDNATIATVVRGGSVSSTSYSDRITEVAFLLGDTSGVYTFTDVVEYPIPLATDKTWPLHLAVDFDSAVRHVSGEFTQTFTDEATGISVTVSAEESSTSIAMLTGAAFTARTITEGTVYDAAEAALGTAFSSVPSFALYDLSLTYGDEDIVLDDQALASVAIPTTVTNAALYRVEATTATVEGAALTDGTASFDTRSLGVFAVVDADTATAWAGVKTLSAAIDGLSLTYRTTGYLEANAFGISFDVLDEYGVYNAYLGQQTAGTLYDSAVSTIDDLGLYEDADIEGVYEIAFDLSMEAFPYANMKHSAFSYLGSIWQTSLSATVPASGAGTSVYLVEGTAGEGITSATRLDSTVAGGVASVDLASRNEMVDAVRLQQLASLWNAASGWDGQYDSNSPDAHNWTDSTSIAYVVVVREAPTSVDKPTAATGLVYDGTTQTGVPTGDGYTLSVIPSATTAGDYVAQANLEDGYMWSDGTTDPVLISWSIAKAELTATYSGETVSADATAQLAVQVTGFIDGETAANADGFTAPTVTAPSLLATGQSYELTPSGGSATNYTFRYVSGVLKITAATAVPLTPGTYQITANLYVPAAENDILGLTAYMTSPKNPLVAEDDPDYGIPTSPVSDNATLVVGTDNSKTLLVDLPNPAFTLIGFGEAESATVRGVERDGAAHGTNTAGRITQAAIALDDGATSAVFVDSHVYAAPLQLDKTWDLSLSADLASAVLISPDTTLAVTDGDGTGTGDAGDDAPTGGGAVSNPDAGSAATTTGSATLKPGTYIVTANVWLSRQDTGLPLDPHLTSSVFPPMDPVTDNATLVVDPAGRAVVTVPIVIQTRIMAVRSITGTGVTTAGGDAVTSMTIDLGVLTGADTVVTRSLTASVSIGELAMSIGGAIFDGTTEHTWPATFQLNLSGVPTSGGGTVPAWVAAALDDADTETTADDTASQDALEAARQANEESKAAARADDMTLAEPLEPVIWYVVAGATAVLLAAAASVLIARRRRVTT